MARVVRDETRHVALCSELVDHLGGWLDDAHEPGWVRQDRRLPVELRVARSVVGSMCIGETVSVFMLRAARERATDPVAREVLTRMSSDEAFHSRFGWLWLEEFFNVKGGAAH